MLARFASQRVRQPGAPCPLPPRRLAVRRSPHRQPRQARCRPRRCSPRSAWRPGLRSRRRRFREHSSCMPCRQRETGQSFCWCRATPSRWARSASWCRQQLTRARRTMRFSREIASLPPFARRGGGTRGHGLPATRAILHIGVIAFRVGTVIPGSRCLGRGFRFLPAFNVYRRRGWHGYGAWRVVVGRIVVGPWVIPRPVQEWVECNSDAQAIPSIASIPSMRIPSIPSMRPSGRRASMPSRPTRRPAMPSRSTWWPTIPSTWWPTMPSAWSTRCNGQATHAGHEHAQPQNRPLATLDHCNLLPV
jgi:hypothetical protein